MNKTLSIGLAGFSFIIEEHAYIKLSDYLAALRNSLDDSEADEVMHDIEIRMVEIFRDALGKREVINDSDVEKVIAQIGKPEEIEEQEEAYFSEKSEKSGTKNQQKTSEGNAQKQLFRDPENMKIGGVCAGLAHYFGIDISWMRLIWAGLAVLGLFTYFSSWIFILIYIILWMVLPVAKNTSDFLKMKGKPVNFDTIKEESGKIVQFANDSAQKAGQMYNENKPFIRQTGNAFANIFRFFFGGIFGIIGLSLLFGSFVVFSASFGNHNNIRLGVPFDFYFPANTWLTYLALAFAFFSVFIPCLIFLFLSIKLIAPKTRFNHIGYVFGALGFLWIILLAIVSFKIITYKNLYSGSNEKTENISINTKSDSILVDLKKVEIPQNFKSDGDDLFWNLKTVYKKDDPNVKITKKSGDFVPYLIVKKEAGGYNKPFTLEVPVEIQNNKILLPNYMNYSYEDRFRDHNVDYELVVPEKKIIIRTNKAHIDFSGDGFDDDDDNSTLEITKNKITINGKAYQYDENEDSVTIDGEKYSKEEAEKMIEKSVKKVLKNPKNVNINIKNGKDEISIKTK
jgi:phage shock protein PspC (stress-responsive transcriptional regulator)